ncbi:hypothetical protein ACED96_00670 [Clostridium thermobutyricum]|uniref:Mannosyltransferase related to Gpi18 n=1 Tax=Clostridium thermobutyricum DSM 4928 TaxID=1121339 RepID=A0A1V4SW85_9CLOT|nr:hypothetical protein [Clostridium thermobutyricum]OPX48583.1 hypothetical protein CLTHE_11140 [Clostridium thermobutyricum DSM 4928]
MKNTLDKKIYQLFDKYFFQIFVFVMILISIWIRYIFINFTTDDYTYFLKPWVNYIATHGGLRSLATIPANYNVPYLYILTLIAKAPQYSLYLIKIVSIIFDYILAFAGALIIGKLLENKSSKRFAQIFVFLGILFIPTVILNGSAWAQCDGIYSSFCLFSIYFLLDDHPSISFIFFGIAFAFKLQAIFILPVLIILYFSNRKYSILNFLWIPIVNVILYIPALISGRSFSKIISIYFTQESQYKKLTLNMANIYSFFHSGENNMIRTAGIIFTLFIFAMIFCFIIYKKKKLSNLNIVTLSLLSVLISTYFLPGMHGRYVYLAVVLSVIYAIMKKSKFYVAIILMFNSFMNYIRYLWAYNLIDIKIISAMQFIILICVLVDFFKDLNKGEELIC